MKHCGTFYRLTRRVLKLKHNSTTNIFSLQKHPVPVTPRVKCMSCKNLLSAQSWNRKWQLQHFTAHSYVRSKDSKEENTEEKKKISHNVCISLKRNKKEQKYISIVTAKNMNITKEENTNKQRQNIKWAIKENGFTVWYI